MLFKIVVNFVNLFRNILIDVKIYNFNSINLRMLFFSCYEIINRTMIQSYQDFHDAFCTELCDCLYKNDGEAFKRACLL